MKVHNMMEEIVASRVNILFDQISEIGAEWFSCGCPRCRLDTCCYVLNRTSPQYILSSRGVARARAEDNRQLLADIDTLVMEGIKLVNASKRPFNDHEKYADFDMLTEGPVYNFPTFVGTIYDGTTFEPLNDVQITLKQENEFAAMIDRSWVNPYKTNSINPGTYTFWMRPQFEEKLDAQKTFSFSIEATALGYERLMSFFSITLFSESLPRYAYNSTNTLKLQDLYLFPKGM
ncbi:MAG: late competence development ComFB family protein [Spirochaetaceae bacterium]|jgi:competence protein ComFB|nr:late competence development ComFB family protein [Spirochaetaceae bacterium]